MWGPAADGIVPPPRWSVPVLGRRVWASPGLVAVGVVALAVLAWLMAQDGASRDLAAGAAVALAFAGSVAAHELGHVVAARRLGYRVEWVLLGVFGGTTSYSGPGDRPLDRAAIALAGPAATAAVVTVLLAAGGVGLWAGAGVEPAGLALLQFNVLTMVLNLVPFRGSDGWHSAAGIVTHRRGGRPPAAGGTSEAAPPGGGEKGVGEPPAP